MSNFSSPERLETDRKVDQRRKKAEKGLQKMEQILDNDPRSRPLEHKNAIQTIQSEILQKAERLTKLNEIYVMIRNGEENNEIKTVLGDYYFDRVFPKDDQGAWLRELGRWLKESMAKEISGLCAMASALGERHRTNQFSESDYQASYLLGYMVPFLEEYFSEANIDQRIGPEYPHQREFTALYNRSKWIVVNALFGNKASKIDAKEKNDIYEEVRASAKGATSPETYILPNYVEDNLNTEKDIEEVLKELIAELAALQGKDGADDAARRFSALLIQKASTLRGSEQVLLTNLSQLFISGSLALLSGDSELDGKGSQTDEYEELKRKFNPLERQYEFFVNNYTTHQKKQLLQYGGVVRKERNALLKKGFRDETGRLVPDEEDNQTLRRGLGNVADSPSRYFGNSAPLLSNGSESLGALGLRVKETDAFVLEYFQIKYRHVEDATTRNDYIRRDMYQYALLAYRMFLREEHEKLQRSNGYESVQDVENDKKSYEAFTGRLLVVYENDNRFLNEEERKALGNANASNHQEVKEKVQKHLAERFENVEEAYLEMQKIIKEAKYTPQKREDHTKKYLEAQQFIARDFGKEVKTMQFFGEMKESVKTLNQRELLVLSYETVTELSENLEQAETQQERLDILKNFFDCYAVLNLFQGIRQKYIERFGDVARAGLEYTYQRLELIRNDSKYAGDLKSIETFQKKAQAVRQEFQPAVGRYTNYLTGLDTSGILRRNTTYQQFSEVLTTEVKRLEDPKLGPSLFKGMQDELSVAYDKQARVDAFRSALRSLPSPAGQGMYAAGTLTTSARNGFVSGSWGVGIELGSLLESPFVSQARLEGHEVLKKRMKGRLTSPMSSSHKAPLVLGDSTNFTADNVLYNVGHGAGAMIALLSGAGFLSNSVKGAKITMDGIKYALQPGFIAKGSLFTAGFVTTVGKYFEQAFEETDDVNQSWLYACIQSGAAGLLELISPNALVGIGPMQFNKELLETGTRTLIVRYFLKEILEENAQEVLQDFSEKSFNKVFNKLYTQEFESSMTWNDIKAIVLITSLTTGLVQSPNSISLSVSLDGAKKLLGSLDSSDHQKVFDQQGFPLRTIDVELQSEDATISVSLPADIWSYARTAGMVMSEMTASDVTYLITKYINEGGVLTDDQMLALRHVIASFSESIDMESELMDDSDLEKNLQRLEELSDNDLILEMEVMIDDIEDIADANLLDTNTMIWYIRIVDEYFSRFAESADEDIIQRLIKEESFLHRLATIDMEEDTIQPTDPRIAEQLDAVMFFLMDYIEIDHYELRDVLKLRAMLLVLYEIQKGLSAEINYEDISFRKSRLQGRADGTIASNNGQSVHLTRKEREVLEDITNSPERLESFCKELVNLCDNVQALDGLGLDHTIQLNNMGGLRQVMMAYSLFKKGKDSLLQEIKVDRETDPISFDPDVTVEIEFYNKAFEYLEMFAHKSDVLSTLLADLPGYRDYIYAYQDLYNLPGIENEIEPDLEARSEDGDNGLIMEDLETGQEVQEFSPSHLYFLKYILPLYVGNQQHEKLLSYEIIPHFMNEESFGDDEGFVRDEEKAERLYEDFADAYTALLAHKDILATEGVEGLSVFQQAQISHAFFEYNVGDRPTIQEIILAFFFIEDMNDIQKIGNRDAMKRQINAMVQLVKAEFYSISEYENLVEGGLLTPHWVKVFAMLGLRGLPAPEYIVRLYEGPETRVLPTSQERLEILDTDQASHVIEALCMDYIDQAPALSPEVFLADPEWKPLKDFLKEHLNDHDFIDKLIHRYVRGEFASLGEYDIALTSVSATMLPDFVKMIMSRDEQLEEDILVERDPFVYESLIDVLFLCRPGEFRQVAERAIEQGFFYGERETAISSEFLLLLHLGVFDKQLGSQSEKSMRTYNYAMELLGKTLPVSEARRVYFLLTGSELDQNIENFGEFHDMLVADIKNKESPSRPTIVLFFQDLSDQSRVLRASFLLGRKVGGNIIDVHTMTTLQEKVRKLAELGFSYEERSILLRSGICGNNPELQNEQGSQNPIGIKIEELLVGELKDRLRIDEALDDEKLFFQSLQEEVHYVTYFLLEHIVYEKTGEVDFHLYGVESLLLAMNSKYSRSLAPQEILEIAGVVENIIVENISLNSELLQQETGFDAYLEDMNASSLSPILHSYPVLHEHQEVFKHLIEKQGITNFTFIGRGQQGYVIDIGDDKVLKLLVGLNSLESMSELASHQLFYEGLQDIKSSYPTQARNIFIPDVSDQMGLNSPGAIVMQKVEGTSIQYQTLIDEFKTDLTGISGFLLQNQAASKQLQLISQRLIDGFPDFLQQGANDEDILSILSVEDIKTLLYEKYRLGQGSRDVGSSDIYFQIFSLTQRPKSEIVTDLVQGLFNDGKLGNTSEDEIPLLTQNLIDQLNFVEKQLRERGLIHRDLHASNVLFELDTHAEGTVDIKLFIIDFGIVEIDLNKFGTRRERMNNGG